MSACRDQISSVTVMDREIKETLPHQKIFDATENLRVIALTELRKKNADCLHALALQRTGNYAGHGPGHPHGWHLEWNDLANCSGHRRWWMGLDADARQRLEARTPCGV